MESMSFDAYLLSKKIHAEAFMAHDLALYQEWELQFQHLHPNAFTDYFKFSINQTRRKYPLPAVNKETEND